MARDRKRAKQRRARRPLGPGEHRPDRGARADRAADGDVDEPLGLEENGRPEAEPFDEEEIDSPLGPGTAAPSPLEHASADVDEAHLAEMGYDLDDERPGRVRDRRPEDETLDEGLADDAAL
jgi:hypothetical protein